LGFYNDNGSRWLLDSLTQAAIRLPQLTEVVVEPRGLWQTRVPFGLFANLSNLSVTCHSYENVQFNISQTVTAITNSPQLRSLSVNISGLFLVPISGSIFARLPADNPLRLEHLDIGNMDATVDRVMLPHLKHLTSFRFKTIDVVVAQNVWTSFRINDIKLSDVVIEGIITEETMTYLASFSGLKKLAVHADAHPDNVKNMLFADVLPKHVDSLQMLEIPGNQSRWVRPPYFSIPCYFYPRSSSADRFLITSTQSRL
jgi:hypothetical protein